MRRLLGLAVLATAAAASPASAADPAVLQHGQEVFARWCAPCHGAGPGHPGTQALAAKYNGAVPAELERRTDLTPAYVAAVVRHGVSIMPIFRKTEVSDDDLAAVEVYLRRNTK